MALLCKEHAHHTSDCRGFAHALIMVGLGSRLEKVSPDIDFFAGDGGEQGQPEKDLIFTRLFHIDGSFEIRLNWNYSDCKYNLNKSAPWPLYQCSKLSHFDITDCLYQRVSVSVFPDFFLLLLSA